MKNRLPEFDRLSIERFRFAHGRAPRGTGAWVFGAYRNGAWTEIHVWGSFSEARKQAMREARELGCDTVAVRS